MEGKPSEGSLADFGDGAYSQDAAGERPSGQRASGLS